MGLVGYNNKLASFNNALFNIPLFSTPFTITIDTTLGNTNPTFQIPTRAAYSYDFYVDFGDNTEIKHITSYNQADTLHTYATGGIYTLKFAGYIGSWFFNNTGDCLKLTGIIKWGNCKFGQLDYMFYGCTNIGSDIPTTGSIYAPDATTAHSMFMNCGLTNLYSGLFDFTANITVFNTTFSTNNITSIPSGFFDYTTKVTNFYGTFNSNLLETIPVCLFNKTILVTLFGTTFANNNITYIPEGLFDKTPLVNGFFQTFYNNKLTAIPNRLFYKTLSVTSFQSTFAFNNITSIPEGLFDKNILVDNFYGTFQANYLTSIPNRLFFYNILSTTYSNTFSSNNVSYSLPAEIFNTAEIAKVTTWFGMFYCATTATSPTGTMQDIWNFASAGSIKTVCFFRCTALSNYASIPVEWI